ncbi:MAG: phosphoribosyltransferase [Candidatus Kerfeldbacteria bacterium]
MRRYVITEDLEYLMKRWTRGVDYKIPDHNFFVSIQQRLIKYLNSMFTELVLISYEDLSSQLKQKIQQNNDAIIISIDQVYCEVDSYLEINRIADINTLKKIGLSNRPGCISIDDQLNNLPKDKPIIIIDDGCFSGDTLYQIISLMKEKGLNVQKSIIGIMIDWCNNQFIRKNSTFEIESVYEFNNVIDWLCERDFFIGVPLSGKTVGYMEGNSIIPYYPDISLPYCLPFGNPSKSASIPTNYMVEYSKFIIGLSCELWEEIERLSGKVITCNDIPRLPIGINRDNRSFSDVLVGISSSIK